MPHWRAGTSGWEPISRCMRQRANSSPAPTTISLRPGRPIGVHDHHFMTPRGPAMALPLADGRSLIVRRAGRPSPPPGPVLTFALLALGIGVGAFPVVRRLTRRLERLQAAVTEWGAGNLATRVPVEGRDEVAQLAASFNEAATRIEQLVGVHKIVAGQCVARTALAAGAHPPRRRTADDRSNRRAPHGTRARYRRTRPADRRNPAGEPTRRECGSGPRAGGLHRRRGRGVRTVERAAAGQLPQA